MKIQFRAVLLATVSFIGTTFLMANYASMNADQKTSIDNQMVAGDNQNTCRPYECRDED
jgi:hypothetical protein